MTAVVGTSGPPPGPPLDDATLDGAADQAVPESGSIAEQAGDWLVHILREAVVLHHVAVRIPVSRAAGVDEFDESHAAFRKPARGEGLPSEAGRLSARETVERKWRVAFSLKFERIRHGHLHPERGLERAQPRGEHGIVAARGEIQRVEIVPCGQFQLLPARSGRAPLYIRDWLRAGDDERALMRRRRNSDAHPCPPAYGVAGAMTMKAGRLRFSVPRP